MTQDYNAKLAQDYEEIRCKVERGMLPLVARIPAIDKAVSEYVIAREEHLASKKNPPIAYRDADALHRFADLVMHEELRWSHPDKMTIVEYPVMSDRQERTYRNNYTPKSEIRFGDLRYLGKRKIVADKGDESYAIKSNRILPANNEETDGLDVEMDVQMALDSAKLTDRQREAIALVYFGNNGEGMSHAEAGEVMGVSRRAVGFFIDAALSKLERYLTLSTTVDDV